MEEGRSQPMGRRGMAKWGQVTGDGGVSDRGRRKFEVKLLGRV